MSKGFDWCIARASDPAVSGLADRDWSKAMERDSWRFISREYSRIVDNEWNDVLDGGWFGFSVSGVIDGKERMFKVYVHHDPDADFTYFSSASELNDSTMMFEIEMERNLVNKVFTLTTADKSKVKNGIDFTEIYWTVGDFVFLSETDRKFAPLDKQWMKTRMTVLLPLRMDVK